MSIIEKLFGIGKERVYILEETLSLPALYDFRAKLLNDQLKGAMHMASWRIDGEQFNNTNGYLVLPTVRMTARVTTRSRADSKWLKDHGFIETV